MGNLRICLVSLRSLPLYDPRYNRENVIGGAEINLYNLALCLSRMENVSVSVFVDDYGQPARYRVGTIELVRFRKEGRKGWAGRKLESLLAYIRLLLFNSDAFIFTSSNRLLGILVLLQGMIRRKKVIFRLSSDLNADAEDFEKRNGRIGSFLYMLGLKHSTFLVSQTVKQKTLLYENFKLDSKIIENGFFIDPDIRLEDKKHILWVGRCLRTKNPMRFLELAQTFPDELFVMIMPLNKEIPDDERGKLRELAYAIAERAEKIKNLTLIDYVPYQDIQDYFDKAKLYVCTSDLEGFPNTFIQACLGGTPILSYSINPSGMIEEYGLGCFCNNDDRAAIGFIQGLDSEKLRCYAENARRYVSLRHNIYAAAGKYLELIGGSRGYAQEKPAIDEYIKGEAEDV